MKLTIAWISLLFAGFMPAFSYAQDSSEQITRVEKKVTRYLTSYYMSQGANGAVDVDIDTTEAVQGWTGRYITSGTATVTTAPVYENNYACHFEVTSEIDGNNVVKIIDIKSEKVHSR